MLNHEVACDKPQQVRIFFLTVSVQCDYHGRCRGIAGVNGNNIPQPIKEKKKNKSGGNYAFHRRWTQWISCINFGKQKRILHIL